jgi:hypothetical protein
MPVMTDSRTVAGVGPDRTFAYRDADWQKIKLSLDRVGVNADAVTVGDRYWAQPPPATALTAAPQRPLREQLQEMAADYRGLSQWDSSLTPKQEAAKIQKVLQALAGAHLALTSSGVGFISYESGNAREAVGALIAKAERHRDRLLARGNRSSANAHKTHIEYWRELVVLWEAITSDQAHRPHRFLLACSVPAFPAETTKSRIRRFLDQNQNVLNEPRNTLVV